MIDWIVFAGFLSAACALLIFSRNNKKLMSQQESEHKDNLEMIWVCPDCGSGFQMSVGKEPKCCPWCGKESLEQIEKDFDDPGHIFICPNCGEVICSMCLPTDAPKICPSCKNPL